MRRIRWAPAAADDLEGILNYLREHHPSLAQSTIRKLYLAARSLKQFSNRGRIGQVEGTCDLVMTPLPHINVYGVEQAVEPVTDMFISRCD